MKKSYFHIVFWISIYLIWTYIRSNGEYYSIFIKVNLVEVLFYMLAYYILKHLQIPVLFNKGKVFKFWISIIISSFILYFLWRIIGLFWLDEIRGLTHGKLFKISGFLQQTVQVYSPAVILLALESYSDRQAEIERIDQLEKEKLATELKFLKAQINPHFLFNTLNNLYSNVITKSPKAPEMVMQLSGILDYVLYRSQNKFVPLLEEIDTIENFLNLEKIRYGSRLEIEYFAEENLLLPVSPLILLSIVENAFKHGASGDIDKPIIRISIKQNNDNIKVNVWNTKSKYRGELNDAYKKGIGLKNIKRQLNLIYPNNHILIIEDEKDYFNILLTITPTLM